MAESQESEGTPEETSVDTGEQLESSKEERKKAAWLAPYQFKKGQSGNPSGRPAGSSLKDYARRMLNSMDEKERQEFLQGIDKKTIWEMAEGKPKQDLEIDASITGPSAIKLD